MLLRTNLYKSVFGAKYLYLTLYTAETNCYNRPILNQLPFNWLARNPCSQFHCKNNLVDVCDIFECSWLCYLLSSWTVYSKEFIVYAPNLDYNSWTCNWNHLNNYYKNQYYMSPQKKDFYEIELNTLESTTKLNY